MVFEKLTDALHAARQEQELPDYLAEQILFILDNREKFRGREDQIAQLTEQVSLYDTYGQTGYLGMGVSNLILEKSLQRLIDIQPEQQ
ncbi:GSU3529 family protein [Geoalkalibacter halelectricus]|uniref:GSU3529 family protein n=1 Tax=Geoalkalibacter halelectricus TaxID=2847045 RepID=UPI003D1D9254